MAGPIATSAFNPLGQYASSPGTWPLLRRTRRFFPSGDLDHCQYSLCLPTEGRHNKSRRKKERRPFTQESVGVWRKDEVQWMSLAVVVGDRKGIQPQNLCTNYPSWNVLSSTPLPSPPFLLPSEKDAVGWCETDVWRRRVTRDWANQVHLEGWLLNWCVRVCVWFSQWARELGQQINHPVRVPLHACEHNVLYSKPMQGVAPNMPGNIIIYHA